VLGEISCEVAGDLGDKRAGRMSSDTKDVDYATLELDHEKHIELVETDRVHDEEVGGQDALGLGGDELFPGRSTARNGSETVAAKDPADRACGDADPKPAQLALDANTSPAAVLPAESDDELDDLITKWRTPRTSLGSPSLPLASRELPMPAEQSLGRDEKATPVPPWKKSAEHSQDRSVCGSVADAAMELPLQHPHLVAKHHQLDVLVQSCPSAGSQHLKNAARDEIAETEAHGRWWLTEMKSASSRARSTFWRPTATTGRDTTSTGTRRTLGYLESRERAATVALTVNGPGNRRAGRTRRDRGIT
jgi:hypothetical protein